MREEKDPIPSTSCSISPQLSSQSTDLGDSCPTVEKKFSLDTNNKDVNSKNTSSIDTNSEDTDSEDTNSEDIYSENTSSGNTCANSEDSNSENTNSEDTNSEDTNNENRNSKDTDNEGIPGAIKLSVEDKFLDPQDVLTLLLTHRPIGKSIPRGIKENVAFVLENENNLIRNANGNRACYVDDCGAWSSTGSCKTHHYTMEEDEKLDYVDKKNGQYVKCVKGKRVVIDPQPPVDKMIVFKRYYTCLKRDSSYK